MRNQKKWVSELSSSLTLRRWALQRYFFFYVCLSFEPIKLYIFVKKGNSITSCQLTAFSLCLEMHNVIIMVQRLRTVEVLELLNTIQVPASVCTLSHFKVSREDILWQGCIVGILDDVSGGRHYTWNLLVHCVRSQYTF